MGREHVRAPQHDQLREPERLRVHAYAVIPQRVASPSPAGDRAQVVEMVRCAQHVPEPAPCPVRALNQAHAAGTEVGPDTLGSVSGDRRLEPGGNGRQRLIPRDASELAGALSPDAPHRIQEAFRRTDLL
jgi:hypothetical protein